MNDIDAEMRRLLTKAYVYIAEEYPAIESDGTLTEWGEWMLEVLRLAPEAHDRCPWNTSIETLEEAKRNSENR